MESELYDSICEDIKSRSGWAARQAVWYQMRRDGLRRRNKPFPGAADTHFPLIDSIIEKFKPFYSNQLFATSRLADFVSKNPQASETVTDAAWWFDYKLKQRSNLEREITISSDSLLQNGRGILKVIWDAEKKRIRFDSIDPIYLIVPPDTEDLQCADRIVHVRHFTVWKYKNGPEKSLFNQEADFIKSITGGDSNWETQGIEEKKRLAEGITHTSSKDTIILWEVYERKAEGGWKIHTISPSRPNDEVRPVFELPYNKGPFKNGAAPFVDFQFEECEKGYYSPRGVAEILAPFEHSLCKMWNEKHDAMTYYNRPLFYTDRDIPNVGNVRMRPGDILPYAIQAVNRGAPPISWDEEMKSTRLVAEQRIAVPDFGIAESGPNKTAREVDAIAATNNTIVDGRSRLFRRSLTELFNQAWAILVQYDSDLEFLRDGAFKKVDKAALDEISSLEPNGSSDSWNQQRRLQKSMARFTLLRENPFIDQGELTKSLIELDEPALVERLFRDPKIAQQDAVARIMRDIPALESGLPVPPGVEDNDEVSASVLMDYMGRNALQNKPVSPEGVKAIQARLAAHMQRLQQSDPNTANALKEKGKQIMAAISQQKQQQQGGMPV